MYPDFVRLWIFNKKFGNYFERKLRIYKNFHLEIQIYLFLLSLKFFLINVPLRRLYWSDVCTSLMFVLVRCLYWSNVCTGPTFALSDVCKSYVCTVRRLWVRRLYWYRCVISYNSFSNFVNEYDGPLGSSCSSQLALTIKLVTKLLYLFNPTTWSKSAVYRPTSSSGWRKFILSLSSY